MTPPEFRRRPAPGPYPSPRPHEEPTAEEVAAARRAYDSHVPSMFARQCLAPGCGEWPCRPYREAVAVLRAAGVLLWT